MRFANLADNPGALRVDGRSKERFESSMPNLVRYHSQVMSSAVNREFEGSNPSLAV